MALVTCPQCGKQISDKAVKCPHCGFVSGSSQNNQPSLSSDRLQQGIVPKKTRKKWWIIPIVVVGISAIMVPLGIFNNKENPDSELTKLDFTKTNASPYNTYYSGTIGTAQGCMTIDKNGQGSYTYDCNGTDLTRSINVKSYDSQTGHLLIESYDKNGIYIGQFEGYLNNGKTSSGTFTNFKGSSVNFQLHSEIGGASHTNETSASGIGTHKDNNNYGNKSTNSQNDYVVIDGSELRLRLEPSTSADTFKWGDGTNRHPKVGEKFKYLGESGDFYQIDFHGHHLWVLKLYTHIE